MTVPVLHSANERLTEMARKRLAKFLATEPTSSEIDAYFKALVYEFGSVGSTLAADYYDARRAAQPIRQDFKAIVVPEPPQDEVSVAIRWAQSDRRVKSLDGLPSQYARREWRPPNAGEVAQRLDLKLSSLILRPGRDTIVASVAVDPARPVYVRRPNAGACAFCLMLSARSINAYKSRQSAGHVVGRPRSARQIFNEEPIKTRGAREVGEKYHDNCGCTPEPVWPGEAPPFDTAQFEAMYADAVKEVGDAKSTAAILTVMREAHGLR